MSVLLNAIGVISIHALHEESDLKTKQRDNEVTISIHALHEESDLVLFHPDMRLCISIHALHEESDCWPRGEPRTCQRFQSTLSMRRATVHLRWPSPTP